jgi:hypothetical protein
MTTSGYDNQKKNLSQLIKGEDTVFAHLWALFN